MAKLVLKYQNLEVEELALDSTITIGRSKGNNLMIQDGGVSRNHAKIFSEQQQFFLEDMGSRNGTKVNKKEIRGKYLLKDNDEISIGKHSLLVLLHEHIEDKSKQQETEKDEQVVATHRLPDSDVALKKAKVTLSSLKVIEISKSIGYSKIVNAKIRRTSKADLGVEIISGESYGDIIKFDNPIIAAGKGPEINIPIAGNFKKNVLFVISNRLSGTFISPPKEDISLTVDGKKVESHTKLEDGCTIEAQETKMSFFRRVISSE